MASGARQAAVRGIERLYDAGSVSGLTEGQLLERFVSRNDSAAFEAIVTRHGPMVLTVCRRWLRDPNDVDDAFQATFYILVRKAGSLRDRNLLGNWLYGVAYKVAVRARAMSIRRKAMGSPAGVDAGAVASAPPVHAGSDDEPLLYEEVHRLPDKYRSPIVLCYLEGLSHEQAAERLNWPIGTVKGRLARARDLLRTRLTRRGVTVASPLAVGEMLAHDAQALGILDPGLVEHSVRIAMNPSTAVAAGIISAQAAHLSQGVLHLMSVSKLKSFAILFGVAGTLASGAGVYGYQQGGLAAFRVPEDQVVQKKDAAEKADGTPPQAAPVAPGFVPTPVNDDAPPRIRPGGRRKGQVGGGQTLPVEPMNGPAAVPGRGMTGMGAGGFGGGGMGGGGMGGPPGNGLRWRIAALARQVVAADKSPKTKEILAELEKPVAMSFATDTPLDDVIKYIKSATASGKSTGIPIYVDPVGLQEAEKTTASTVVLDLDGVPLKTTLRLLLKQLDLAYCVRDGLLIISSLDGILGELMEAQADNPENGGFGGNGNPGGFQ